jgi:hypothetical protein
MLVKELKEGTLAGHRWSYHESAAYNIDPDEAEAFDAGFVPLEKKTLPSQEEFFILSHSRVIQNPSA